MPLGFDPSRPHNRSNVHRLAIVNNKGKVLLTTKNIGNCCFGNYKTTKNVTTFRRLLNKVPTKDLNSVKKLVARVSMARSALYQRMELVETINTKNKLTTGSG